MIVIKLCNGGLSTLDVEDEELLEKHWFNHSGYVRRKITRTSKSLTGGKEDREWVHFHRLVIQRKIGRDLERHEQVDHIDGNTLNNCRENLRIATHAENVRNSKSRKNSTSKYVGVSWRKRCGKWVAKVRMNKKDYHVGYFDNEVEAAKARDVIALKLHGEFSRLNYGKNNEQ